MIENLVNVAVSNGRLEFALLIILTIYVLRVNSNREAKYQETIDKLSTSIVKKVDKIETDVDKIGDKLDVIKEDIIRLSK